MLSGTINTTKSLLLFLMMLLFLSMKMFGQEKPVSVMDTYKSEPVRWMKYTDSSAALYNQIVTFAESLLNSRHQNISQLNTKDDWNNYNNALKIKFSRTISEFKKTPLKAVITNKLEREDFIVEKVVYQSLPGFYVTGCLFIPKIKQQEKLPAVIIPTGHSQAAFRRDVYQNSTLNLVKKGFVVFTYDPIGQGERVQYWDNLSKQSFIGGSTFEHSYAGAQCLLTGNSISDYFIWDGVRAIDYLVSRTEVDSTRIGMTGVSGGGTQTAFVSALDNRIIAAAPECYITSYQRLFESIGPQDAEQNLYKGLYQGIEHVDLLSMRLPKPTMIISTTQDFFSIQGARETFQKARQIYTTMGYPENMRMIEADGAHGSKKENREGMYRFFQKELKLPGNNNDLEVEYFKEEELLVTTTGQVSTSYNSKTIYDFNKEKALAAVKNRAVKNPEELLENKNSVFSKIYELSGYDSTRQIRSIVYTGKIEKEKYKIEKYFIQGKDFDYPIPYILIKPFTTNAKRPLLLYLDASGKDKLLNNEEEIISYLERGYTILAPDLIGNGELENKVFEGDSYIQDYSFNIFIAANLIGKSIAGMQASDLDVLIKAVQTLNETDADKITAVVKDEACSSFLHFAVFNRNRIKTTFLINPLISFEDVATTRFYKPKYLWTAVPGAVHHYDLTFLQALLAPQILVVINPVTAKGEVASLDKYELHSDFIKQAYDITGSRNSFKIIFSDNQITKKDFMQFLQ